MALTDPHSLNSTNILNKSLDGWLGGSAVSHTISFDRHHFLKQNTVHERHQRRDNRQERPDHERGRRQVFLPPFLCHIHLIILQEAICRRMKIQNPFLSPSASLFDEGH